MSSAKKEKKRLADSLKESQLHNAKLAAEKRINIAELDLIAEQSNQNELDIEAQYLAAKDQLDGLYSVARIERLAQESEARLVAKQLLDQQELELQIQSQTASAAAEQDDTKRREALDAVNQKAHVERLKLQTKQELDIEKQRVDTQLKLDQDRVANRASTLSTIATLSSSNNITLAQIGKAAGIAQIAIDTPVAISKALAAFPPPFNFAAAALVGAAEAAQAAQIAGLNFETGGIVPGASFHGDNVQANVNSGEMILNRQQQARLFEIANGNSGNANLSAKVDALMTTVSQVVNQPLIVQVDGKEIF